MIKLGIIVQKVNIVQCSFHKSPIFILCVKSVRVRGAENSYHLLSTDMIGVQSQ